ncbi:unnamed protein product [Discosporangium mesarthrocarpum]
MAPPLFSNSLANAIAFTSYAASVRQILREGDSDGVILAKQVSSGCVAGAIQTVVLSPAELVKCKLQVQVTGGGSSGVRYRGPLDCVHKVFAAQGVRGLYQGLSATIAREVPANGIYFGFYEAGKSVCINRLGLSPTNSAALAGGLSGALSWAITFPVDYAKSVIQTLPENASREQKQVWSCLKNTYNNHGARYMFRGVDLALLRAALVNACLFSLYEATLKVLLGSPTNEAVLATPVRGAEVVNDKRDGRGIRRILSRGDPAPG